MRVAVFMDVFPGPSQTFILHHIVGLLETGHGVVIFARAPTEVAKLHADVARHDLMSLVRYLPCQQFGPAQLAYIPLRLARNLARRGTARSLNLWRYGPGVARLRAFHALETVSAERFDLIHCHYASIGWAFLPYRDIFGVPFITSFHGDHYRSFGRDGGWWLRRLFERGDAFVANSSFTRNELVHLGCPASKVTKIPAMVEDRGAVFRVHAPAPGAAHLLTIARLHESKGIQVALRAVRVLLDQGIRVRYSVAGDGPYRTQLTLLADQLGLNNSVIFHGWVTQEEAYALYAVADLFILPSVGSKDGTNEAQGLVIQEAQLHGVPVVASALGGIPESVEAGQSGTLFRVGDHHDLAAQVHRALADPAGQRSIAARALSYVQETYTRPVVMNKVLQLYQDLLERRSADSRSTKVPQDESDRRTMSDVRNLR